MVNVSAKAQLQYVLKRDVSRETMDRLEVFQNLLTKWLKVSKLVGPSALQEFWSRHVLDSAQLLKFAPETSRKWVDLGTGAGFPGLVIGILLREQNEADIHLIESNQRKAAFLRTVSRETNLSCTVHCGRVEFVLPKLRMIDVITSRAAFHLEDLLNLSAPSILEGAVGLFLRGQGAANELNQLERDHSLEVKLENSLTDPSSSIIVIRDALKASA